MVTSIAIDVDGPLITVQATAPGGTLNFFALSTAYRIEGAQPGRVLYDVVGKRFAVREAETFVPTRWDMTPEGKKVRVFDALLRVQRALPGSNVAISVATDFGAHLAGEMGEGDAADVGEPAIIRLPQPAHLSIASACSAPRSLMAGIDWMTDDDGFPRQDRVAPSMLLVDVGPKQTAIVRIIGGDAIDEMASHVLPIGWLGVAEVVEARLVEAYGVSAIRPGVLAHGIYAGEFRVRGERARCDDLLVGSAKQLTDQIESAITDMEGIDPVVVVGLPALHLAAALEGRLHGRPVWVPDAPAFANVRGLLKFAANVEQAKQETSAGHGTT